MYLGIIKTLEKINDITIAVVLKKMNNTSFIAKLHLLKYVLTVLSGLRKTFQTGAINFTKIKRSIIKMKTSLQSVKDKDVQTIK